MTEQQQIGSVLDLVDEEIGRATAKFGPFNSAHEGYAVIKEEVDELWDEIKSKDGTCESLLLEAVQVAAMAVRFVVDVCMERREKAAQIPAGGAK